MSISEIAPPQPAEGPVAARGFDRWAFGEYLPAPADLAVFRIIYALAALLLFVPELDRLGRLPENSFRPPLGPYQLLDTWPPGWVLQTAEVVLVVALVAVLVGYRTTFASFLTSIVWVASNGLLHSTGKINHGLLLFSIVPLFCGLAGWGRRFSLDARRRLDERPVEAWPMALLALTVGGAFVTASIPKIQAGWLDPATQAVHRSLLVRVHVHDNEGWWGGTVARLDSGLTWELVDVATIVIEAGLVLLVLRRRSFLIAISIGVLLHTSIMLVLGISFTGQVVAYGAFVGWGTVVAARGRGGDEPTDALDGEAAGSRRALPEAAQVVAVVVVGVLVHRLIDARDVTQGLLRNEPRAYVTNAIWISASALAIWHLLGEVRSLVAHRQK